MISRALLTAIFSFVVAMAAAQPAEVPLTVPFRFPAVFHASIDFGDANGDGDLDVAITGKTLNEPMLRLFMAADSAWFLPTSNTEFRTKIYHRLHVGAPAVVHGSVRWGDFDGDGDGDLLVSGLADYVEGTTRIHEPTLVIYENERIVPAVGVNTTYSLSTNRIQLPGLFRSAAEWGDYDGDGDLDFVAAGLPSLDAVQPITQLYRNDGGTFVPADSDLPGVHSGDLAWADYDGDGDLDVALMGDSGGGIFIAHLYRNDGGQFSDSGLELPGVAYGSLDWGDYDRDGDPDLLLTGGQLDPRFLRGVTRVYRNDGGTLVDGGFDFRGHALGAARWGDADRDGDLDVFVIGSPETLEASVFRLYTFSGSRFVPTWEFTGMRYAAMDVADYNGDGDADVLITGRLSVGGLQVQFMLNRDYPECADPTWLRIGQSLGHC